MSITDSVNQVDIILLDYIHSLTYANRDPRAAPTCSSDLLADLPLLTCLRLPGAAT
jgi:hypothetical protein